MAAKMVLKGSSSSPSHPDYIKASALVVFVTLKTGVQPNPDLTLKQVSQEIGPVARPDEIRFTEALPKSIQEKLCDLILSPAGPSA